MQNVQSPRVDDAGMEQRLQEQSRAPRITLEAVENNIYSEHYFTAADGVVGTRWGEAEDSDDVHDAGVPMPLRLLTFCVLVLQNGFTVTGESACASPENFDAEIGRQLARRNAVNKIWPLMGYELRSQLALAARLAARHDTAIRNSEG